MAISACIKQTDERGYMRASAHFDEIKPGVSTQNDVMAALGSPSSRSSFGEPTWYYISDKTETIAFLKPKIIDQNVVSITFDAEGKVASIDNYNMNDRHDFAYSDSVTPTEGNHFTLMQQLLGNLGRFSNNKTDNAGAPNAGGGVGGSSIIRPQ